MPDAFLAPLAAAAEGESAGVMSVNASLLASLVTALALSAVHLAAPKLRRVRGVPESAITSFAGGLAVSYIFLHLLPELAQGNEDVHELLGDNFRATPLTELGIFVVALVGFVVFFVLERLARRHGDRHSGHSDSSGDPAHATDTGMSGGVFAVHVGAFALYNGIITYSMALRFRTGAAFAVLFALAMGLHFVFTDRTLEEHYPRRFEGWGRGMLAAALLVGWFLSWVAAPTNTAVVAVLVALLAGSVLLNVFKDELPEGRRTSFPWFVSGLAVYSAMLAGVTALSA